MREGNVEFEISELSSFSRTIQATNFLVHRKIQRSPVCYLTKEISRYSGMFHIYGKESACQVV